jgi:hypothetical protein
VVTVDAPRVTTTGRQNALQLDCPFVHGSASTCTEALDTSWLDTVTTYSPAAVLSSTDMEAPLAVTTALDLEVVVLTTEDLEETEVS